MKKINTAPISGMQELLPVAQKNFNHLKSIITDTYFLNGFLNIETPTIDRTEILFAKAGGDTEKQVYKVFKTAETTDDADEALRFDHTVPLARYVVEHESNLTFPFKVTQIGRNFRGERAQKGRYREFYQCDVDIIGRNNLPLGYDADVIATLLQTFQKFQLRTSILARINNRKIISGLLEFLALSNHTAEILNIIDHAEKVPLDKTKANFAELGLSEKDIAKLIAFINLHGARAFVVTNLKKLGIQNATFDAGVDELDRVLYLLEIQGFTNIEADMKIVRGLDYYTGTVFEFNLPDYPAVGSVCGGGRYENLASHFTEQAFPGVGGSIGLTRLFHVLTENNLIDTAIEPPIDYAIIPISNAEIEYSLDIASDLKKQGFAVNVVLLEKSLGDKLTYAGKIAKNAIIIGEDEINSKLLKVKNLITGETTELAIETH